ncbi:uncharacterized protein LOC108322623 [Vigna angularis]|uniref:uncharacterized protein LOC108322623 n=1 Tax=Phaseolus angularis TaxID=3914 RepID=UPI00080A007A|nr:uncharacterized protein LOC108322623 [Vigna angularis]
MDRYQKTVRRVKALSPELALHYILPALKPGPFKDSVCRRAPKIMEELRERATDEIRVEEMKLSYKEDSQELWSEKANGGKPGNLGGKPGGGRHKEPRRGPRFQQYTPLNAPREKILREALSADLLPEPVKRPTPSGADESKHYAYHKNMGHTTEECITLKDKIEQLIQVGKLKKYIRDYRPKAPAEKTAKRPTYRSERPRNDRSERPRSERRRSQSRSRSREHPLRGHINTISGGFAGGASSASARKRHIRALHSVHSVDRPRRTMPPSHFRMKTSMRPTPIRMTLW